MDAPARTGRNVTLFAAGSLSQALRRIADAFHVEKGVCVLSEFGSTARMVKLIEEGRRCDVFAAADMLAPLKYVKSGRAKVVVPFVRNDIVAVVHRDSGVSSENLQNYLGGCSSLRIGISDPETQPCGANALLALSRVVSTEELKYKTQIVTGGLEKKREKLPGERSDYTAAFEKDVDLLVIFRTTALKVCRQSGRAEMIDLPPAMLTTAQYGVCVLNQANRDAHGFVDYLRSQKARRIFLECGFH